MKVNIWNRLHSLGASEIRYCILLWIKWMSESIYENKDAGFIIYQQLAAVSPSFTLTGHWKKHHFFCCQFWSTTITFFTVVVRALTFIAGMYYGITVFIARTGPLHTILNWNCLWRSYTCVRYSFKISRPGFLRKSNTSKKARAP